MKLNYIKITNLVIVIDLFIYFLFAVVVLHLVMYIWEIKKLYFKL